MIGFDLFTKLGYIHTQVLRLLNEAWPPNGAQQKLMRKHFSFVFNQQGQQVVFGSGKLYRLIIFFNGAQSKVYL